MEFGRNIMRRILLVSDDQPNLETTAKMLEELGWEVDTASTRDAARQAHSAHEPRLAMVDVEMRGGAGFETISEIRRASGQLLIIGVTRDGVDESKLKTARVCGADGVLFGPATITDLATAIEDGLVRLQ